MRRRGKQGKPAPFDAKGGTALLIYLQLIETEEARSKFELLYRAYRDLMFSLALRILGSEADAEDAVHQAFLKLTDWLDRVDDPRSPQARALLALMAEHAALDLLRQRRRTVSLDALDELEDALTAPAALPVRVDLQTAMAALPARYREPLLLRHHMGFSVKEIAEMLDLSEANVYKTLQRAGQQLRRMLDEEEAQTDGTHR